MQDSTKSRIVRLTSNATVGRARRPFRMTIFLRLVTSVMFLDWDPPTNQIPE